MSKYQFKFLAPLINFDCEAPTIQMQKGLAIRKISNYEKKEIHELVRQWSDISYGKFLLEYVILKKNHESVPNDFINEARINIEKAITILRLYKHNIVGSAIILQPLGKPAPYSTVAYTLKHYQQLWVSSNKKFALKKYTLSMKEANDFKKFFKGLYRMNVAPLEFAIAYLNKSYTEPHTPRDSLMNLLHALENLYLRGDNQELTYTLSVRLAHNLASEFKKKKKIFDDIQRAYECRNKMFYDGKEKQEINDDFLFRIRDYTRESLKQFMKHPNLLDNKTQNELVLKK